MVSASIMHKGSANPNSKSSPEVRISRNDFAQTRVYSDLMARKTEQTDESRPDWFLHEWMAERGIKQAELARRCGWSKATMHDIYHGETEYYRVIVNAIADALDLKPWELLMPPAEAYRIERWRAAFEQETYLRAAEERQAWRPAEAPSDRLAPPPRAPRKPN